MFHFRLFPRNVSDRDVELTALLETQLLLSVLLSVIQLQIPNDPHRKQLEWMCSSWMNWHLKGIDPNPDFNVTPLTTVCQYIQLPTCSIWGTFTVYNGHLSWKHVQSSCQSVSTISTPAPVPLCVLSVSQDHLYTSTSTSRWSKTHENLTHSRQQ